VPPEWGRKEKLGGDKEARNSGDAFSGVREMKKKGRRGFALIEMREQD